MAKLTPRNNLVLILIFVAVLGLSILFLLLSSAPKETLAPARIMALIAYLLAFVSVVGSVFMRELVKYFGRKFLDTHHIVTLTALAAMVIHPILAVTTLYPVRFLLPDFTSWYNVFARSGPFALLLFVIASLIAWLRARLKLNWRVLHWLVYLAFLVATVHAALLGRNMQTLVPRMILVLLALVVSGVYIYKRNPPQKKPVKS
ncbi:MAG: hypothetical protein ACYC6L_11965 [Anaerolineae bacterium]